MVTATERERLRTLIDMLIESLDDDERGAELARRAYLSRFHFDRLVAAALGETPAAFRRRLLLERAAYQLTLGASVTEAAFDAGYSSPRVVRACFPPRFRVDAKRIRRGLPPPRTQRHPLPPAGWAPGSRRRHEEANDGSHRAHGRARQLAHCATDRSGRETRR